MSAMQFFCGLHGGLVYEGCHMVYVTGDTHAELDRFKSKEFKQLHKGDTLLICGDFGFVWDGSKQEQKNLKWLAKQPYDILFVEGTHDNLHLLSEYPEESFCGGRVRNVRGNIRQLLRGEIYRIEDNDIFAFGGGQSPDMDARIEGETWWREELPTKEEIDYAISNLEKHNNVVDYIVTHSPSLKLQEFLDVDYQVTNQLGTFLNDVSKTVRYKRWYFGKYHLDKLIPPHHYSIHQILRPLRGR